MRKDLLDGIVDGVGWAVWILVVVKWFSGGVTADFGALKSGSHGDAGSTSADPYKYLMNRSVPTSFR